MSDELKQEKSIISNDELIKFASQNITILYVRFLQDKLKNDEIESFLDGFLIEFLKDKIIEVKSITYMIVEKFKLETKEFVKEFIEKFY